LQQKLALVVSF